MTPIDRAQVRQVPGNSSDFARPEDISSSFVIDPGGPASSFYDRFSDPRGGGIDHILKIHSLNPPSLLAHHDFYRTVMRGKSPLSRIQREMIAVVVSAVNRCHY